MARNDPDAVENISLQEPDNVKSDEEKKQGYCPKYVYNKAVLCGLLISIIIILVIVLIVGRSTEESRQERSDGGGGPVLFRPSCPQDWMGYEGKCYFFSKEERNWTSSQNFCSAHNSSLAVIESKQEKGFILRFKCTADHWIGLQKDPAQTWRWTNGTQFNNMFEIKGEGGDCVYLSTGFAVASRCYIARNWICSHPDVFTRNLCTAIEDRQAT